MNREGHVGLTLLILSPLAIPFGWSMKALMLIVFSGGFSSLPDLDQKWHKEHRTFTHNIGFGFLMAIPLSFLFGYFMGLWWGISIFSSVFIGVLSHLLGDIIAGLKQDGTPWKLKPLKPFSDKEIGFGFWKATNKEKNELFLKLGGVGLFLYWFVTSGMIYEFI